MQRQFAVIGLGRFGLSVAKTLTEKDCQVLCIDIDEEIVQDASEFVTQAVKADATDEEALKAVGLENIDVAVVSVGNIEASILTTLALKEIGVKEIVAKAVTDSHGKVLTKVGATKVVFPERDMGTRIANILASPKIIEHLDLSGACSIVEMEAPKEFVGKSLKQIDVRAKYGLNVVAIRKKSKFPIKEGAGVPSEKTNISPQADDIIAEGDVLLVIGDTEKIEKMKKIHKKSETK